MLLLRKRNPKARTWYKKYPTDVGMDLVYVGPNRTIWPHTMLDLDTGWDIKVPYGHWGHIKSRSSTFYHKKLLVLEGVIDPDYTGALSVAVFNPTFLPRRIRTGDRLAQLIIQKAVYCEIDFIDKMPETSRGKKGFGSTKF